MMVSFSSGFFSLLPPGEGPGMRDRAINEAPPSDLAAGPPPNPNPKAGGV